MTSRSRGRRIVGVGSGHPSFGGSLSSPSSPPSSLSSPFRRSLGTRTRRKVHSFVRCVFVAVPTSTCSTVLTKPAKIGYHVDHAIFVADQHQRRVE